MEHADAGRGHLTDNARLADALPQATCDADRRYVALNDTYAKLFGTTVTASLGRHIRLVHGNGVSERLQPLMRDAWEGRPSCGYVAIRGDSHRLVHLLPRRGRDGRVKHVTIVAQPANATERELHARDEVRRRRVERAESLRLMAASVAHDFNNLLVGVLGNADLMSSDGHTPPSHHELLGEVRAAAVSGAALCKQLLTYAGRERAEMGPVNIGHVLREAVRLGQAIVSREVQIVCELPERLPRLTGNATQLQHVVINLLRNADDAMRDNSGRIVIDATIDDMRPTGATLLSGHRAPRYLAVSVSDTGEGMPREVAERAFDPFFTTKRSGSGLGLASVAGVMRNHQGFAKLRSRKGVGTTVSLYFPVGEQQSLAAVDSARNSSAPPAAQGNAVVLVVDDDERALAVACRILERNGYVVVRATSGAEAQEVIGEHADRVDLGLLDVRLTDMSGTELAATLRKRYPAMRIAFCTGDSMADTPRNAAVLEKPYRAAELLACVRGVLMMIEAP